MKSKPITRIKVKGSEEMQTLRETVKALSGAMNFRYRIRERKNKLGTYASVELNRAKQ